MKTTILVIFLALFLQSTKAVTSLTGSGTASAPYLIGTIDDLKFLRDQINLSTNTSEVLTSIYQKAGVYFKLTANIDLNAEEWTPVGNTNTVYRSFRGVFDGNGYSITNLKIGNSGNATNIVNAGLFAYVTDATITNLTVVTVGIYATGVSNTSILAATVTGSIISNCNVSGILSSANTTTNYVGGLIGKSFGSKIVNCMGDVTITSNGSSTNAVNCGGLVGNLSTGTFQGTASTNSYIYNSYSKGSVYSSTVSSVSYTGGLVGLITAGNIYNCYSSATVKGECTSGSTNTYVGGIIGHGIAGFDVKNCIALNTSLICINATGNKQIGRIAGATGGTAIIYDADYGLETMTVQTGTASNNLATVNLGTKAITNKQGADLGTNVPATLLNTYLSTQTGLTIGTTNIYIYKPWVTAATPAFGTGTTLNSSNLSTCITCNVFVPAEATLNNDAVKTFNTVTLAPVAKLTLTSGNTLTATNGLTMISDATGTATLVDNTTSSPQAVTATVQQYVTAGRNWYMSSPVTSAAYTLLNKGNSVVQWNEGTKGWDNVISGTLTPGRGYIQVASAVQGTTGTVDFTGTTNTGDVTVSLYRSGTTQAGFNLVGNPYPSYLDWKLIAAANTNVLPTIWLRSKTSGGSYTFATVNVASYLDNHANSPVITSTANTTVTTYIPPMQAYWVRLNAGASITNYTVTNAMRTHADNSGNTFKAPSQKTSAQALLRLQVSNGTNSDEAVIYFNPNATNEIDVYDSPKMANGSVSVPEIYTVAAGEQLVINGLNSIHFDTEMPIGFTTGTAGSFSRKASQVANFDAGTQVILKDYLDQNNPVTTDLTDGESYSFTSDVTTNNISRFGLTFKAPSGITGINPETNRNVWIAVNANNQLVINGVNGETTVAVYNLVGQKLLTQTLKSNSSVLYNPLTLGVYMVTVSNAGKMLTKKVIID